MAGKGTYKTIIDSITPSTILDPGVMGGNVRVMYDKYVGTGAEAGATLTVQMGNTLPTGARILWVAIRNQATGATIHVGDAEDTDRYINAAADNATTDITDVNTGLGYEVDMTTAATPDNQILLTLSGAATLTTGLVWLVVMYAVE